MEQPELCVGLLGFSEPVAARLQTWIAQPTPLSPQWRNFGAHGADAWMMAGEAVARIDRDALVIRHPHGSGQCLTLNRTDVDRPMAFATPLPTGFASTETFDADSDLSVRQCLHRFELALHPLRSQFALGAQLVQRADQLERGVVHLMHQGKMLAVIDLSRWHAGLSIPARAQDITQAEWVRRPSQAHDIPTAFARLPLHQLMWTYAVRTRTDALPARHRQQTLYLRRVPQLPPHWFSDMHLLVMRELIHRPCDLAALAQRVRSDTDTTARHLAALYFAGGITTDPEGARRAEPSVRRAMVALQFDQAEPAANAPGSARNKRSPLQPTDSQLADLTAPMPLR